MLLFLKRYLNYFELDETEGELVTKRFEFIIEACVQLINDKIVELNYPQELISKVVTAESYTAIRNRLMQNCNAFRSKMRESEINNNNIPTLAQRAADEARLLADQDRDGQRSFDSSFNSTVQTGSTEVFQFDI